MPTHAKAPVLSPCPPLEDINLYSSDMVLQEAVLREGGGHAAKRLARFGLIWGSAEQFELGRLANAHVAQLTTHNRDGARINRIDYHPAFHDLMDMSLAEGLHALAWLPVGSGNAVPLAAAQGVYVERAACLYMAAQVDAGHVRTVSMTHSAVSAVQHNAELAAVWLPKITSRSYDPRSAPADNKSALTLSLALSDGPERDVGSACVATVIASDEGRYALTGVLRSVVAPASDGLIVLAASSTGVSCFLVPQFLQDSRANALHVRRLKDTMGLRSPAVAEFELDGAQGWLLGPEGQGHAVVDETIMHARLDTVTVAAALMRQCLAQAIHFAEHVNGGADGLSAQPLLVQTLADMALDAEAASALGFRLARAFDRASAERAAAWRRLMTPVSLYWVSRRAPVLAAEAIECMGEYGAWEDWPLARPFRDIPIVAMSGGTAHMMALEVLRILQREPDVAQTVMEELNQAAGEDPHLRAAHARVEAILHDPRHLDARGRLLVEALASLAAGTILRAHSPAVIADAFIMTRMGNQPRQSYGQGLEWAQSELIVRRASPNRP